MLIDTTSRSTESELLDDFSLSGAELNNALDKIASINQLLGGNRVTVSGVSTLIQGLPSDREIRIVDIGCGNGDMLRTLAGYAAKNGLNFRLTGIDANRAAIEHARELSRDSSSITYECQDFLTQPDQGRYDIVLCTLTLHHFSDAEIHQLITLFQSRAALGIVINDLHRHRLAYYLFRVICYVFRLSELNRNDGLVSILRGFKKKDLHAFSRNLTGNVSIRWKWAFRYQWIIPTI